MPRRESLTEPPAPALAELTALQREQAMGRFAVLRPHLEQDIPLSRSAIAAGLSVGYHTQLLVTLTNKGVSDPLTHSGINR
jgi:putative transposase